MKKATSIALCILIGFLMANLYLKQYKNREKIKPVFQEGEKLYFIQYGIYPSEQSMIENTKQLKSYIFDKINEEYYVFIAITKNNLEKLKGYFNDLQYDICTREISVNNKFFLEKIKHYDQLLEKTEDKEVVSEIIRQVLEKYKEVN